MILRGAVLLSFALLVTGCGTRTPTPVTYRASAPTAAELRQREVDDRKDELLRQLAVCESGGYGDSEKPIYGARGTYVGRFQFMPRTVITFVQQMDGRTLTSKEAVALAHDYTQAAALAKYMIFDLGGITHWPLCNRKLGLAKQVREIQLL